MPKLIVTTAEGNEVSHDLTESQITIGRLPDNMIHIDDGSVSSHHAQLTESGGDYILQDLNSTNGTRVNGNAFTEGRLQDGDHIRFGKVETVYASEIPAEPRPLPRESHIAVTPAEQSQKPVGFANESPFQTKKKDRDPLALGVMIFAIVSMLAFIGAVVKIFQLQPPV